MSRKARDLTGMTFGRLTVTGRSPAQNKNPRWFTTCECGTTGQAYGHNLLSGRIKSCGCWRKGPTARNAVEKTVQDGYVFIKQPGHPRAHPRTGRVREHILMMEEMLGRPLLPREEVHHRNNVRHDNRPENLELWSRSQPAGARVTDLVEWARTILETYEPELSLITTL